MRLFTLGYEKRNIEQYIEVLKRNKINLVVDVRQTAWSHKRDFCKKKFEASLQAEGINYLHCRELGNPKHLRSSGEGVEEVLEKFGLYLYGSEMVKTKVSEIVDKAKVQDLSICLTCFERNYLECHRSVIANYMQSIEKSISSIHL